MKNLNFNNFNTDTNEGKLLLSAMSILSQTTFHNENKTIDGSFMTPEEIFEIVKNLAIKIYPEKEEKWLQEYKKKIKNEVYLILSPRRSIVNLMFWNKSQFGYTDDLSTAGLFTKEEIDNIKFEEKDSIPIKLERGKKNEIGLEFRDVRRAIYLKDSNIKAVLWCESDLNGRRLADVVNDLVREKDCF